MDQDLLLTKVHELLARDGTLVPYSSLHRFCHRAHQLVIEGESYRKRQAPGAQSGNRAKKGGKSQ